MNVQKAKCNTQKCRGCFDANNTVTVERNGRLLKIKLLDLKVGDYVETVNDQGEVEFSKVYYEAHVDRKMAPLLKLHFLDHASNESKTIGISGKHLIYAGSSKTQPPNWPILAFRVSEGWFIWINTGKGKLMSVKVLKITNYFAQVKDPKTVNHRILVNGVHASVHTTNEFVYRYLTLPLRFLNWISPGAERSKLVHKIVRFVQDMKEPIASRLMY
jgi:hypothetical protein